MAIVTGVRQTYNINQDRRVIDISDKIALLEPDSNPLTLILRKINKKKAINPEFTWLEDALMSRQGKLNGSVDYGSTDTVLDVVDAGIFMPNQIVKVPATKEELFVVSVDEPNKKITVLRGYGQTAAGTVAKDADVLILGTSFKENDTEGSIKSTQVTKVSNYTQIFKTPLALSRTMLQTEQYGEKDLAYQRRKMAIEHAVDIERSFLFGEKYEDTTNARRKTGGILSFIPTDNIFDSSDHSGTITESKFLDFLEVVYKYNRIAKGSAKITLFASSIIIKAIDSWAKSQLQVPNKADTYGISIVQYIHPFGTPLNIVSHPLLVGPYAGYAIAVCLELLSFRYIQDTILKTNIQENNVDGIRDMYLTEAGLQVEQAQRHALIKDVTAFA